MNTQTGSTQGLKPSYPPQITPIIIKTGGGGGADEHAHAASFDTSNKVTIESPVIDFKELGTRGSDWESSESTHTGRLYEVTIADGSGRIKDFPLCPPDNFNCNPVELISVTIYFGNPGEMNSQKVLVREAGDPGLNNVVLVIESPDVPFNVTDGEEGKWKDSAASGFQNPITLVEYRRGELMTPYPCEGPDVALSISFRRNTT